MTRREMILDMIQVMSDKTLYTLYDESSRLADVEDGGPNICDLCRHYRGKSCTLPDDTECPSEAYTAWMRVEVSANVSRD